MPVQVRQWLGIVLVAAALTSHRAGAGPAIHELQITASRYRFEPSRIEVTSGEHVRLVLRSKDGVHGFSIPTLKIDAQIPNGGEPVTIELVAPPAGQYEIACSEFCGRGHGQMKAVLISVPSRVP